MDRIKDHIVILFIFLLIRVILFKTFCDKLFILITLIIRITVQKKSTANFLVPTAPAWEYIPRRSSVAYKKELKMGRSCYKIYEPPAPHFLTSTIINWIPVLIPTLEREEREQY